jgi:thiamine kinase-like enzyme
LSGLTFDSLKLVFEKLAQMHRASALLKRKDGSAGDGQESLFSELDKYSGITTLIGVFLGCWPQLLEIILKEEVWTASQREFLEKDKATLALNPTGVSDLMKELELRYSTVKPHEALQDILIHGDLWAGNLCITTQKLFILDFQFITLDNVATDVWFLLYSSVC